MKPERKEPEQTRRSGAAPGEGCESLLRAEIAFWRELLSECDRSVPPESLERMRQALALAERRFLQIEGRRAEASACHAPLPHGAAVGKVLH